VQIDLRLRAVRVHVVDPAASNPDPAAFDRPNVRPAAELS
jgi:hypothetical protein